MPSEFTGLPKSSTGPTPNKYPAPPRAVVGQVSKRLQCQNDIIVHQRAFVFSSIPTKNAHTPSPAKTNKMLWSWLPVYLVLATIAAASEFYIDLSAWENTRYYRNLDLSHPYVQERVLVEITNVSPNPQDLYVLPVNDGFDAINSVSHYAVLLSEKRQSAHVIELNEGIYAVKLPYPVAPGSLIELNAMFVYTDSVAPYPPKINLEDRQQLLLKLNKFCYSPYVSQEYSLTFTGLSKGQEMELPLAAGFEATEGLPEVSPRVDKELRSLTYGPIQATIPSYSVLPMGLLYDHNRPLTHVANLERSFWLPASDVDVVQTEEYYELYNRGAELKSGYSRGDWMKGRYDLKRDHHALSQLEFAIDEEAPFNDYYLTDKVGMVSTHQITQGHLVMQPRFPLFGGWKYNFTLGWSNSLESFVRKLTDEDDTYVAQFPLLNSLKDIHYDKVAINFYLPENAVFLNASALEPMEGILVGSELSYLDVADGHVKVTLEFKNLIDGLSKTLVLVKYKYTAASYWSKVSKIAGFVFVGFMSYYALGLIDLSIQK